MKKIIGKIHLYLGLVSGAVVFIVAITGCLYAFQAEIQELTQPYRRIAKQEKPLLPPSRIWDIANQALPNKHIHAVQYEGPERAAKAIYYSYADHYYYFVYVNPYTGDVLKVSDEYAGFFRFVLDGHFYLWLPEKIGQTVVASATLVFLVMLVTGMILWWPRNRAGAKQRFSIKWNARWRRKNYDLHNVLGFYASWLAIVFAVTGLVWGFQWFRDGYYAAITGGKQFKEYQNPVSDSTAVASVGQPAIDRVWAKMVQEYPNAESIEIHPPETPHAAIAADANPDRSTYWKTDYRYFDQYTLEEQPVEHIWGRSGTASNGEKLMRMNYDIHVGAILGLPGKLLAFCISLIIASLPITGFMIWWGRRNKARIQPSLVYKMESVL